MESEIRPFEIPKQVKSGIFEGRISNGLVFKSSGFSFCYSPNHLKTGQFKIRTILSGFQMVLVKMAPISSDFKWEGFHILDPIQNSDYLQPNLFLTVQNPDLSKYQIPSVYGNTGPLDIILILNHSCEKFWIDKNFFTKQIKFTFLATQIYNFLLKHLYRPLKAL